MKMKCISNEDGEENASEPENQECEIQGNPFRPSNLNKLRTPMQPLSIQNIDLNDSVVINEDRTGEDYHKCISVRYLFWTSEVGRSCGNSLETLGFVFTGLWGVSGF